LGGTCLLNLIIFENVTGPLHLAFMGNVADVCTNSQQVEEEEEEEEEDTPHVDTWCNASVLVVCINDRFCDMRERNMTIRSEI
jgi:hypothetical protein